MENQGKFDKVCQILDENGRDKARLIPILQAVQEVYNYLPEEILTFIASALDISPARVYGVATFFAHFTLKAKGKHIIKVCDGTACHVKRSTTIIDAIRSKLNLTAQSPAGLPECSRYQAGPFPRCRGTGTSTREPSR